jgi:hypothetical protein
LRGRESLQGRSLVAFSSSARGERETMTGISRGLLHEVHAPASVGKTLTVGNLSKSLASYFYILGTPLSFVHPVGLVRLVLRSCAPADILNPAPGRDRGFASF